MLMRHVSYFTDKPMSLFSAISSRPGMFGYVASVKERSLYATMIHIKPSNLSSSRGPVLIVK